MQKILLFLFLILNAENSLALSYRAQCIANRGNVFFALFTKENKLFVKYNNAMGASNFPVYEGTVTKSTVPYLNIAFDELSSIDYELLLSWPVEKCSFSSINNFLVECNGPATFILPRESGLQSFNISTSVIKENSLSATYDIFKMRLGIEGKDFHHSIAMPFDPRFCQAEYLP